MVRRIAASRAGETVVERHRRAYGERSVTLRSLDDGLALLQVVLPEHLAHAILDRLTRLAQQVITTRSEHSPRGDDAPVLSPDELDSGADRVFLQDLRADDSHRDDPELNSHPYDSDALEVVSGDDARFDAHVIFGDGDTFTTDPSLGALPRPIDLPTDLPSGLPADERGIDAVRTDLLSDLLLTTDLSVAAGTALESIQARIQVTIAAETLAGIDERPAELDGIGALHPDVARDLAGRNGGWSRLFLDCAGVVTATAAYAPTATATAPPGQRPALSIPRVPHTRPPVPDRPQSRPRQGWSDVDRQPEPLLRRPPRAEASRHRREAPMASQTDPRRRHRVDQSARPPLHRRITAPRHVRLSCITRPG